MPLPRVKINFADGALGIAAPMDDGVAAYLAPVRTAAYQLLTNQGPVLITSYADLALLGYTTADHYEVCRTIEQFYREAPKGSKLWLLPFDAGDSSNPLSNALADLLQGDNNPVHNLLRQAKGEVRLLIADTLPEAGDQSLDAPDASTTPPALAALQDLCQWATNELYAPCMAITTLYAGVDTNCGQHPDLTAVGFDRVCVVEGCEPIEDGATLRPDYVKAIGLLAGRLAAIPVQRSAARVKSGPIAGADLMWLPSCAADSVSPGPAELRGIAELLHDRGYIVPRTFVGKTGYYWSDDTLLADPESDYALIPRRRTIDKAYRIAYQTLVNEIGDEIAVTNDGRPAAPILKAIETKVESAIVRQMTSQGNLGTDPTDANDLGVQCYINPDQPILATNRLDITLKVKPYGYAKYIEVELGFLVEA